MSPMLLQIALAIALLWTRVSQSAADDDYSLVPSCTEDEVCFLAGKPPVRQTTSSTCSWQSKFLVTRLWTVDAPSQFSSEAVVAEFRQNFAPIVTGLDGFLAYLGAPTKDISRAFFANVFASETEAALAQAAAKDFVEQGVLNGKISPYIFAGGQIQFQLTTLRLCLAKEPSRKLEGKVLSIFSFLPKENNSAQAILDVFLHGFGPAVRTFEGFNMFLGADVVSSASSIFPETGLAFLSLIFDTHEQANFANEALIFFSAGLKHKASLINTETAVLNFALVA